LGGSVERDNDDKSFKENLGDLGTLEGET